MSETQEQPKKRLSLRELASSPEVMKRFGQLIVERLTNLNIVVKSGSSPVQCLMSEICVLEAKVDALMFLLEKQNDVDFTEFNKFLEDAAASGAATAVNIRHTMMKR